MSAKRPGTVDYSKWDNLESSDDSSDGSEHGNSTINTTACPNIQT